MAAFAKRTTTRTTRITTTGRSGPTILRMLPMTPMCYNMSVSMSMAIGMLGDAVHRSYERPLLHIRADNAAAGAVSSMMLLAQPQELSSYQQLVGPQE